MSSKRRAKPELAVCQHSRLTTESSPAAVETGCVQYTPQQLYNAATGKRKRTSEACNINHESFPAPLALLGDSIRDDPKYPPQSFLSWLNLPGRNAIAAQRKVLYVAAPPAIGTGVEFLRHARTVQGPRRRGMSHNWTAPPAIEEIVACLQAFYYGIEVKILPKQLCWVPWEDSQQIRSRQKAPAKLPEAIGLKTTEEIIRIHLRHARPLEQAGRDVSARDLFQYQANQLDLLEVAEAVLPEDAYALLLVVNQDLYEDKDDDFCCGRAFGGSRIAAVSMARYDPTLDEVQGVDREHVWPASHCADFVAGFGTVEGEGRAAKKKRKAANGASTSSQGTIQGALSQAVKMHLETSPSFDADTSYLLRVCRTASHELGHCFGMDHCMHYACVMQGTSSLVEDSRQPPYLCPVCEAKLKQAMVEGKEKNIDGWEKRRHEAMLALCTSSGGDFAPLAAWTRSILARSKE